MTAGLQAFLLALVAAYGVFLVYTAVAFGWRGVGVSPGLGQVRRRPRLQDLLVQAGLDRTRLVELVAVEAVLFTVAAAFGYAVYGGIPAALAAGLAAAAIPVVSARNRRRARLAKAREAWPRMLEEIRLQVVTLGRSIPQALLTVGARGPEELRPAFALAQREWLLSTDLDRTLEVLKAHLADPTADAVCETLLIAHEVGGTDVDRRLRALIDDRIEDLQGRKDARAKQAAVRFARWFVLVVPIGMALVGLSIGDGRAAFQTATGQLWVLIAFAMMAGCWLWAGQLLRLPEEERVFVRDEVAP
ncbi:MAG: type II secretion system F family protein [Nitriliruptoraceae bacterium]